MRIGGYSRRSALSTAWSAKARACARCISLSPAWRRENPPSDSGRERHRQRTVAAPSTTTAVARPAICAINCAAIVDTLLESELFGHEKGAFTGAVGQKKGKLERPRAGPCFSTRSANWPRRSRPSYCGVAGARVRTSRRHAPIKLDIRLITATNVDLNEASRAENSGRIFITGSTLSPS